MKIYKQLKRGRGAKLRATLFSAMAVAGALFSVPAGAQSTTPPSGYCTATHGNMGNNGCAGYYGFHLFKVGLNGWMHNFNCANTTVYRYWNNFGSVTTLSQGANYTLTTQTASTTYTTSTGAWIDWNQDGTFSNTEYIGTNTTGGGAPTFNSNFTVPCNATPGNTILRVRAEYNYACGPNYGCGTTQSYYGETVDYIITISGTGTATADFSVPDSVYTNSPARFINSNQGGYIGHQWDVMNVGNNPDATTTNFDYTFPNAGQYQLRLSSTNCSGTANKTKTITVIDPTSPPVAEFVISDNEIVYDGSSPIYVDFFDLSTFGPSQWDWIITPDNVSGGQYMWSNGTNYSQNPSIFCYDVMTYDICLAVGNSAGWDTICKSAYLEIIPPGSGSSTVNWMIQNTGSDAQAGTIYDSGGPNGQYQNNEYSEFLIAPCGASSVTLTFDQFTTQSGVDALYVYNGDNTAAPLLGTYTGTSLPGTITGNSGKLFLVFLSNNGTVMDGFKANWTSNIVNNGPAVADFSVADSVYLCGMGNDVYFTNTSTGVVPGQATYDWIFEFDPNVTYPTGYSDMAATDNPTWTYYAPGTYNVRMVMRSCEGNDTVVKTFVVASTSNNPIVDFEVSNTILKVGGVATLNELAVADCEYEWVINPTTYTLENGSSVYDPTIEVSFNAPGSYNVKLMVTNDNGTTVLEKTNLIDVIEYCKPAAFYSTIADVGISEMVLDGNSYQSNTGMAPGYSDFTDDFSAELILGATYSVELKRSTKVNAVNRKVWIDYNRDGDFDDANELVASESNSSAQDFSANFTVPGLADVIVGEARMRVAIGLGGTSLVACGPTQVGEYEDYTVILTPDGEAPVLELIGGIDTVIEVNSTYTDPGAKAFDNLEGDISSEIVVNNGVATNQAGVYLVTYNVSDKSGNAAPQIYRRVTVVTDLTKPMLTIVGGSPLLWSVKVPFVDPGATAVDMPSGNNIDHLVTMAGSVNVDAIGDYTIDYEVYDDFGNMAKETRIVQVRDTTRPVIVANAVYNIQVGMPFVDPVKASDNFDSHVAAMQISGSVNTMIKGVYTHEYTATDLSGNVAYTVSVDFDVDDYIKPVIKYTPGTEIVEVEVFDMNWEQAPGMLVTASDNYYGFADLDVIYPSGYSPDVVGTYVIVYKATDQSGNEATLERTVMVVDKERPVIVTEPLNLPRWQTYDLTQGVLVKDNYYSPNDFLMSANGCQVILVRSNVDFNYPGVYEVSYMAIDGSGNKSFETSRIVSISEGQPNGLREVETGVKVYPNPNQGNFTIAVEGVIAPNATVSVVNALGQVVFVENAASFTNGQMDVSLTGVQPGVYFVRIQSGNQTLNTKVTIQ